MTRRSLLRRELPDRKVPYNAPDEPRLIIEIMLLWALPHK
jgi:hypothetical protein